MSYQRKKNYQRKPKPQAKAVSRWTTYSAAGSQLAKDVSMLKGLINTEFKAVQSYHNSVLTSNVPVITLLNGIAQGDDINQRGGRTLRVKSIEFNMNAYSLDTSRTALRWMLVIDTMPNGVVFSAGDLLDTQSAAVPYNLAQRNLSNRKRFIILKDKIFPLAGSDNSQSSVFSKYYKKFNMQTVYNGTGATISSIQSNALYLVHIGGTPATYCTHRLRYIDN